VPTKITLRQAAEADPSGKSSALWTLKRLAESIQMEPEVLEQLLEAGLRPGGAVRLRGVNQAHVMLEVVITGEEPLEVELPLEVAQHLFVEESSSS
jgi:DtxR family Mn-dependent transcriptional regulator